MSVQIIKMKKISRFTFSMLLSIGSILVLAGCAQVKQPSPNVNVTKYQCAQGESVQVKYFIIEERAVLERNGESIELKQKPSGSGFIYSNGPNTIRGKGGDLSLEIGRMVPIECKAL